ncbi:unnamed protein product [Sphagnum balticum]
MASVAADDQLMPWDNQRQLAAVPPLTLWETAAGKQLTETNRLLRKEDESDRRKVIVDAANAILIGASLIASVTYASWLILPYDNIVHRKAVKVFWACNSLSFFFAVATVLASASAAMPNFNSADSGRMFSSMMRRLRFAASLFVAAVLCVLAAFATGAYLRVPHENQTFFLHDPIIGRIIVPGAIVSVGAMLYFIAVMTVLNH